jgi:hypothetical protein
MVQRLQDECEVNTYTWRFKRPEQDPRPTFPAAGQEIRLATVKVAGVRGCGRAVIWLVNGHFFSIGFDKPPRSLGPSAELRVTVVKVEVDPMKPSGGELTEHQLMAELAPAVLQQYQALRREARAEGLALLPPDELYGIDISGQRFVVVALLDGDGVIAARSGDEVVARFLYGEDEPETYPDLTAAIKAADSWPEIEHGAAR